MVLSRAESGKSTRIPCNRTIVARRPGRVKLLVGDASILRAGDVVLEVFATRIMAKAWICGWLAGTQA